MSQTTFVRDRASLRAVRTGYVLSGLTVVVLLADAAVNLVAPDLIRAQIEGSGFEIAQATQLGWLMLACAVLYAVPQTAVLGAILVTGFLGGAICAHFRLGEVGSPPQVFAAVLGLMAWGGLYLREPRLRDLLPTKIGGGRTAHAAGVRFGSAV